MFCLFLSLFCMCMYRRPQNAFGAQRTTCLVLAFYLVKAVSIIYLVSIAWSRLLSWTSTRISCIHFFIIRALGLQIYVTTSSFFTLFPGIKLTSSSLCRSCTFIKWTNYQTPNTFLHVFSKPYFQSFSPENSVNTTEVVNVIPISHSCLNLYFSARTPE